MSNFSEQSLSIIGNSSILTNDEFLQLTELQTELYETYKNVQIFRTRTEMEASILTDLKYPTADSKYWQCVREQNVMFTELVFLSYEYRKNQVEISIAVRDMAEEKDLLKRELMQIDIDRKKFIALNQVRTAKDRIREIHAWHEIKERLIPDMICGQTDVDKHQLLSYTIRWIQQLSGLNGMTGISERNNLVGQADKGLKLCAQFGLIGKLEEALGKKCIDGLTQKLGVDKNGGNVE